MGAFNQNTPDCDESIFHYFWGGHKPSPDWGLNRIVSYTKPTVRTELPCHQTDNAIEAAVNDANFETIRGSAVHYVNIEKELTHTSGVSKAYVSLMVKKIWKWNDSGWCHDKNHHGNISVHRNPNFYNHKMLMQYLQAFSY